MSKRYCTIPAIFGLRVWFEERFGEGCKQHDEDYINQQITRKEADLLMMAFMVCKGYPFLAIITYYGFLRPFGWLYWNDIIGGKNTHDKDAL